MDSIINLSGRVIFLLLVCTYTLDGQITVNTNFDVRSNQPIDTRDTLTTLADTSSVTWTFPGLLSYIQNVDAYWYFDGSIWKQAFAPSSVGDSSIYKLLPLQNVTVNADTNTLSFVDLNSFNVTATGFVQLNKQGTLGFMRFTAPDDEIQIQALRTFIQGDTLVSIVTVDTGNISIDAFLGNLYLDALDSIKLYNLYYMANAPPDSNSVMFWPTANSPVFVGLDSLSGLLDIKGECLDTIIQSVSAFTGLLPAPAVISGDTLIPLEGSGIEDQAIVGVVVDTIGSNALVLALCGTYPNKQGVPAGYYYATQVGLSTAPDSIQHPAVRVIPGDTAILHIKPFVAFSTIGSGGVDTWLQTQLNIGSVTIDGNTNNLVFDSLTNYAVLAQGVFSLTKQGTAGFMQLSAPDDLLNILAETINISGDTAVNIVTVDGNIDIDAFGSGRILHLDADSVIRLHDSYNLVNGTPVSDGGYKVMTWLNGTESFQDLDTLAGTWLEPQLEGGNSVSIAATGNPDLTMSGMNRVIINASNAGGNNTGMLEVENNDIFIRGRYKDYGADFTQDQGFLRFADGAEYELSMSHYYATTESSEFFDNRFLGMSSPADPVLYDYIILAHQRQDSILAKSINRFFWVEGSTIMDSLNLKYIYSEDPDGASPLDTLHEYSIEFDTTGIRFWGLSDTDGNFSYLFNRTQPPYDSTLHAWDQDGNPFWIDAGTLGGGGAADGNGIYSGSDTLPGTVQVTIPIGNTLEFLLDSESATVTPGIRMVTDLSGDDLVTHFQTWVTDDDSLTLYNFDNTYVLDMYGSTNSSSFNIRNDSGYVSFTTAEHVKIDPQGLFQFRDATTAQRDAAWPLNSGDAGSVFYNTDSLFLQFWDGADWQNFGSGSGGSQTLSISGDDLTISGGNTVGIPVGIGSADNTVYIFPGDVPQDKYDMTPDSGRLVFMPGLHYHGPDTLNAILFVDKPITVEFKAGAELRFAAFQNSIIDSVEIARNYYVLQGLDDISASDISGTVTDPQVDIWIEITDTGAVDSFSITIGIWNDGVLTTDGETRPCTVSNQNIGDDIQIQFGAATGHTLGDTWRILTSSTPATCIKVGEGFQTDTIRNVIIMGPGVLNGNADSIFSVNVAAAESNTTIDVRGRVDNVQIKDLRIINGERPIFVSGRHDGVFEADGSTTGGTDYAAENILITGIFSYDNISGPLLGHPAFRGSTKNVIVTNNHFEGSINAIELNHRLDTFTLSSNYLKGGTNSFRRFRGPKNGFIHDNILIGATPDDSPVNWCCDSEGISFVFPTTDGVQQQEGTVQIQQSNTPSDGEGLELRYNATTDIADIISYDRDALTFSDLRVNADQFLISVQSTNKATFSSSLATINDLIPDVTTATADGSTTLDFNNHDGGTWAINMSGVDQEVLDFENTNEGTIYNLHFHSCTNDTITFPATAYTSDNTRLMGSRVCAKGAMTYFYRNESNYFFKDSLSAEVEPPESIIPSNLDSLFYWYTSADTMVLDSAGTSIEDFEGVGTWADLSANGHDATQGTATRFPQYRSSGGPNDLPYLHFDGSNDFLGTASHWWESDDLTVFAVVAWDNATANLNENVIGKIETVSPANTRQWALTSTNTAGSYVLRLPVYQEGDGSPFFQNSFSVKADTFRIITAVSPGDGVASARINGSDVSVTAGGTPGDGSINNASIGLTIGAVNSTSGTPLNPLDGKIVELIVYSRELSAGEIVQIETYLNEKYLIY